MSFPPRSSSPEEQDSLTVADLMSRSPLVLPRGVAAVDALAMMEARQVSHAVVVDVAGDFVGLADLQRVRAVARVGGSVAYAARDDLPSTQPNACAGAAGRYMLHARLHAMPVLGEGGRVIGLLTETDFLRYTIRTLALRGCRCDADPTEPRRLASGARIRAIRQRAAS